MLNLREERHFVCVRPLQKPVCSLSLAPLIVRPCAFVAAQVEMVMRSLGLMNAKDTIIGDNSLRGVSGGERRRVTLGERQETKEVVVDVFTGTKARTQARRDQTTTDK